MAEIILDYKGMKCPLPTFKLGKEMEDYLPGQIVIAISDDPAFELDVEAFCRLRRHELMSVEAREGVFRAKIRKTH